MDFSIVCIAALLCVDLLQEERRGSPRSECPCDIHFEGLGHMRPPSENRNRVELRTRCRISRQKSSILPHNLWRPGRKIGHENRRIVDTTQPGELCTSTLNPAPSHSLVLVILGERAAGPPQRPGVKILQPRSKVEPEGELDNPRLARRSNLAEGAVYLWKSSRRVIE
jgi:hypothetical protein